MAGQKVSGDGRSKLAEFMLKKLSKPAREFVCFVLNVDPSSRPSVKDVLAHPFLKDLVENEAKAAKTRLSSICFDDYPYCFV